MIGPPQKQGSGPDNPRAKKTNLGVPLLARTPARENGKLEWVSVFLWTYMYGEIESLKFCVKMVKIGNEKKWRNKKA